MYSELKILFIHGLEAGPFGKKYQYLKNKGYNVRSTSMNLSLWNLSRRNGILRNFLLKPRTLAFILSLISTIVFLILKLSNWLLIVDGVIGIITGLLLVKTFRQVVSEIFEICVNIQKQEIEHFNPDLLIGSSFGGAVALACVIRGYWEKNTLLLAPALGRILKLCGIDYENELRKNIYDFKRIIVAHAKDDKTIDIKDSILLGKVLSAKGMGYFKLYEIENDTHSLHSLTNSNLLINFINESVGSIN